MRTVVVPNTLYYCTAELQEKYRTFGYRISHDRPMVQNSATLRLWTRRPLCHRVFLDRGAAVSMSRSCASVGYT
jgi:hypothetical protein